MSGGGARVPIPAGVRRTVDNLKEIAVNHSDEEIYYAMLKECSMDPNETVQKLLLQAFFIYEPREYEYKIVVEQQAHDDEQKEKQKFIEKETEKVEEIEKEKELQKIYAELQKIGVPQHRLIRAYLILGSNKDKTRLFFSAPPDVRLIVLNELMDMADK